MLAAISYDPLVHINLGPLNISPHGVGIAVGFLLGARLMLPAAARKGITDDDVYALLTRAAIGAIIGARLAYVLNHLGDYDSLTEVLQVWRGGISLLGGFAGAIALALPEMRKRGLNFWKVMDAAAPGMALGVIVGRVGDLIVADHLGKPTDFVLGYRCPSVETASPCIGDVVHQTALYDMGMTIVLLGVLLWLRRRPRYDGFLILVFGGAYGVQRLIEDFLREDVRRFGLTGSQWTAVATLLLCLYCLLVRRRTPWWGRWEKPAEPEPAEPDPETEAEPPTEEAPAEPEPETATAAVPAPPVVEPEPEPVPEPAPTAAAGQEPAPEPEAAVEVPEPAILADPPPIWVRPAPDTAPDAPKTEGTDVETEEGADEPPTMTGPEHEE